MLHVLVRKILILVSLVTLFSCDPIKRASKNNDAVLVRENTYMLTCPKEGICNLEVLTETSIRILKTEGKYIKFLDKDFYSNVIVISYRDSINFEKVYIQIPKSRNFWQLEKKAIYRAKVIHEKGENIEIVLSKYLNYKRMRSHVDIDLKIENIEGIKLNEILIIGDLLGPFKLWEYGY